MTSFAFGTPEVPDYIIYGVIVIWLLLFLLAFAIVAAIAYSILRKRHATRLLKVKSLGIATIFITLMYVILALR